MRSQLKDAIRAIHSEEYQRLQATEGQIKRAKRGKVLRTVTGWELVSQGRASRRVGLFVTLLTLAFCASLVWIGVYYYNQFSLLLVDLDRHRSLVDNEIQRKANLIPSLLAVSTEYSRHEKALYEHVSEMRSLLAGSKEQLTGESALSLNKVMSSLLAISEQYPDLKATQSFEQLMKDWTETEDRLATAREGYIGTIREYNGLCTTFPSNVYGYLFGEGKIDTLAFSGAREAPAELDQFFLAPAPSGPPATTAEGLAEQNPTGAASEPQGVKNDSDQQ